MLVGRRAELCDHSFPSLATCSLPRFVIRDFLHARQWSTERETADQCPPRVKWERHDGLVFQPQDIEYVVRDTACNVPCGFTVEDYIANGQFSYRLGNGRVVLEQPVA